MSADSLARSFLNKKYDYYCYYYYFIQNWQKQNTVALNTVAHTT